MRKAVLTLPQPLKKMLFFGKQRYCTVCQSQLRRFWTAGLVVPRPNGCCPVCGSLERHRSLWVFLSNKTDLLEPHPKRMLHVAPEKALESKFKQIENLDYVSVDLHDRRAMVKMDITDLRYPDDSFDVIYCSHVLISVPNDRQAMREFNRVLKPNGFAVCIEAIRDEETLEDPTISSPAEQERIFGHPEHVRSYGLDFKDRLEEAGFSVKVFREREIIGENDLLRLGVLNSHNKLGELIFFCKKQNRGYA